MRILIDALSARVGGGITYIRNLLPALSHLGGEHTFIVLLSSRYQRSLISALPPDIELAAVDLPAEPLLRRWWYQQGGLVRLVRERKPNAFFAPAEASYFRMRIPFVMLARNRSVYAPTHSFGERREKVLLYRLVRQPLVFLALHKADRVIFVSKAFRGQVVRQMHLPIDKTRVIYHGLSPIFNQPAVSPGWVPEDPEYILVVSTISPHKNYETLLRAYARLGEDRPRLLIAGKPADALTYQRLQKITVEEGIEDRVRFLGEVPYEELPALYRRASFFVFPSRLETFGHPLVEAMASGTPVIASDLPVCQEICRDAALYFSPDDVAGLADRMQRLLQNTELRDHPAQRGRGRSRDFSWEKTAQELIKVFEELA